MKVPNVILSYPYSPEIKEEDEDYPSPLSRSPSCASVSSGSPLTTWPYSTLTSVPPLSLVDPSQLVLPDLKRLSSSSSASDTSSGPRPKKTKRKARTEEEKEARAQERTMRNRRAAQESRDRKKRQFEALEEENQRLLEENRRMKQRIEQLESQESFSLPFGQMLPTPPLDTVIKSNPLSPEAFESTFHPAVMEYDLQCPHSIFQEKNWMSTAKSDCFNSLFRHLIKASSLHLPVSTRF
jgi:Basic region leucine zipper